MFSTYDTFKINIIPTRIYIYILGELYAFQIAVKDLRDLLPRNLVNLSPEQLYEAWSRAETPPEGSPPETYPVVNIRAMFHIDATPVRPRPAAQRSLNGKFKGAIPVDSGED